MIAATGELVSEDESPEIYVWNLETKDILARLKGFHSRAVRHVFSFYFIIMLGDSCDSRQTDRNYFQ